MAVLSGTGASSVAKLIELRKRRTTMSVSSPPCGSARWAGKHNRRSLT